MVTVLQQIVKVCAFWMRHLSVHKISQPQLINIGYFIQTLFTLNCIGKYSHGFKLGQIFGYQ